MKFINPKTDYAFKKIFGSENSKDILISFLNAIIYQEKETIQDLEILNPYNPATTFGLKDTYLDVKAKLDNQTTVLIEMQILNSVAFDKRVIYNVCKAYSNQLDSGQNYYRLTPVIALTITDFIFLNQTTDIINSFVFKHETKEIIYNQEIKLFFVELPKFKKTLEQLGTLTEKWLYFLSNAPSLKAIPGNMENNSALNHALQIANLANLSVEELEEIQNRAFWLADQEGIVIKAKQDGREEGLAEGREKGLQQGLQQGKKEQAINLFLRILQRRFGEISANIQQKIAELSLTQLELLGEEIVFFSSLEDLSVWLSQQTNP